MEQKLHVNKAQAEAVYLTLKDYLSRKPEGESLIHAFESNPQRYESQLAAYLQSQLPEDDALAEQIANALEGEDGARFANIVTGGQIDQIINIARLGVLNLTVKKSYFAFRDVKQQGLFLATVILVGIVIYGIYWYFSQPGVMDGDFNIAVAQFGEVTENGVESSAMATQLSNRLFDFLDSQFGATDFDFDIQVTHKNIPIIVGDTEAEQIAEKTNAHIVIYGDVITLGESAEFSPRFHLAESLKTNELTGPGSLSYPLAFKLSALSYEDEINAILRTRASILVLFTEGLAYLAADNYAAAKAALTSAINEADSYGPFDGEEVLYLLLGTTYRLQQEFLLAEENYAEALNINPNYARAHIGLGNIYFLQYQQGGWSDSAQYDRALQEYEAALAATDQPVGAYVDAKANYSLGNMYLTSAQQTGDAALYERAIDYYDRVIDQYEQQTDNKTLKGIASNAYYGLGVAYEKTADYLQARDAFQNCLDIVDDPALAGRAEDHLEVVRGHLG
jgi:tetratricopeptide (TPR) repeat protein